MTIQVKRPKLSRAQARVMDWMSQGWEARIAHGSAVEINDQRVCNVDTMAALARLGLVAREASGYWHATEAGKKLSPSYGAPDLE